MPYKEVKVCEFDIKNVSREALEKYFIENAESYEGYVTSTETGVRVLTEGKIETYEQVKEELAQYVIKYQTCGGFAHRLVEAKQREKEKNPE